MLSDQFFFDHKKPSVLFALGMSLVLLAYWFPFLPGLQLHTFIHMWRVEFAASIFLTLSLVYLIYKTHSSLTLAVSEPELKFIVLPLLAFIAWSALSAVWAPSWRSAMHHTLVWTAYMVFYLIIRQVLEDGRGYSLLISSLTVVFVVIGIPAIVEFISFLILGGATSLGTRYQRYGEQVNTFYPLLLVGVLRFSGRRFVLGLVSVAVLWLLIICGFGRINTYLLVFSTAAITFLVFASGGYRRYWRKMLAVCAVLIVSTVLINLPGMLSAGSSNRWVERFTGSETTASSNDFRKLMIAVSAEMITANPLIGVGADNFGTEVNNYRESYAGNNPSDANLAAAENEIPERSHNEFLQILAELGVVGGTIFLAFLVGIAIMAFRLLRRRRLSLHSYAAVLGIAVFLTSSLVSSYSFRFIQNGLVFFFVLAVGTKLLLNDRRTTNSKRLKISARNIRFGYAAGIGACLLLLTYSSIRFASVYYVDAANRSGSMEAAIPLLETAMKLDPENPNAHYVKGMVLFQNSLYSSAVPHLSRTIELGRATSTDFSYLASAQLLAGDPYGAEVTFQKAAALYPRSTFVLTRYASLLSANGKQDEAVIYLDRARAINKRLANTWWTMINDGPRRASEHATKSDDYSAVMDLYPQPAIYAIKAERNITHPGESTKIF